MTNTYKLKTIASNTRCLLCEQTIEGQRNRAKRAEEHMLRDHSEQIVDILNDVVEGDSKVTINEAVKELVLNHVCIQVIKEFYP